ncbi:hypothetical protein JB92DRAFT_3002170 [Gautieria morchelliformis]|nr:hypothetical protein JB92DRAFT_3002170 [Gautieria morchelliformis]
MDWALYRGRSERCAHCRNRVQVHGISPLPPYSELFVSTTDSPLFDPSTSQVHHGGNFQALALTTAFEKLVLPFTSQKYYPRRRRKYLILLSARVFPRAWQQQIPV